MTIYFESGPKEVWRSCSFGEVLSGQAQGPWFDVHTHILKKKQKTGLEVSTYSASTEEMKSVGPWGSLTGQPA